MRQLCFGLALLACLAPAKSLAAASGVPEALFPVDVCTRFYPSALASAHVEGDVMLRFKIAPDGSTENIVVSHSSGNGDLDDAARSCVGSFRYRPAKAVSWHATVEWKVGPGGPLSSTYVPHSCEYYYPIEEFNNHITGTTVLAFTVSTDGYLEDIKVATSSGNANLDAAAVTCAARWHYRPATRDAKPFAAQWQAAVVWQIPSTPPE
jgi:TonB family protein